jgi:hypothetical protein
MSAPSPWTLAPGTNLLVSQTSNEFSSNAPMPKVHVRNRSVDRVRIGHRIAFTIPSTATKANAVAKLLMRIPGIKCIRRRRPKASQIQITNVR